MCHHVFLYSNGTLALTLDAQTPDTNPRHVRMSAADGVAASATSATAHAPGLADGHRNDTKQLPKCVVLVDMDGVLADFDKRVLDLLSKHHSDIRLPWDEIRTGSFLKHAFVREHAEAISETYKEVGFFESLPPISDAINAIREMQKEGFDVCITSSVLSLPALCVAEKVRWVERHLGKAFLQRLIMTPGQAYQAKSATTSTKGATSWAAAMANSGAATLFERKIDWEHVYVETPNPYSSGPSQPLATGRPSTSRRRLQDWTEWRTLLEPPEDAPPSLDAVEEEEESEAEVQQSQVQPGIWIHAQMCIYM